jgi:hypothetical protein
VAADKQLTYKQLNKYILTILFAISIPFFLTLFLFYFF